MRRLVASSVVLTMLAAAPVTANAGEGGSWWSGDWYAKVGVTGFVAPRYEGARSYLLQASPIFTVGKAGGTVRFSSRNDNPSFALVDTGPIRAGIVGKLIMPRDKSDSDDLKGLAPVKLGLEAGFFAEAYPTDFIRLRGEVRRGIRSHDGFVADVSADAFTDITPDVRIAAGPRATFATASYFDAYYGVDARQSAKSGLARYNPKSGIQSAGVGTEINWKVNDRWEMGAFAEYKRLLGPAADSSLVKKRGSADQYLIGLSTSYRFGFTVP